MLRWIMLKAKLKPKKERKKIRLKTTSLIQGENYKTRVRQTVKHLKTYQDSLKKLKGIHLPSVMVASDLDRVKSTCHSRIQNARYDIRRYLEQPVEYRLSRLVWGNTLTVSTVLPAYETLTMQTRKNLLNELREEVRYFKSERRRRTSHRHVRSWEYWQTVFGTHTKPGEVLLAVKRKTLRTMSDRKSPWTDDFYLGIEIELLDPESDSIYLKEKLAETGWIKNLNLGTDVSVRPRDDQEGYGRELRIIAKLSELKACLTDVSKVLSEHGCFVNKTCGLHVHLDHRNIDNPMTSYERLVKAQKLFYQVVPKSRRDNKRFCRKSTKTNRSMQDRFRAINYRAYHSHRTIEVRLHSGTIEAHKIFNWVLLLLYVMNCKKLDKMKIGPRTFKAWVKLLGIRGRELEYWTERVNKFSEKKQTEFPNTAIAVGN
jgi:hypothetical protein